MSFSTGLVNSLGGSSSDVDSLRHQENKLIEKLQTFADDKNHTQDANSTKERKQVIVELSAVGKELGQKVYQEKYNRLENERLKRKALAAKTARARNQARREREQLLNSLSAEKMAAASQKLDEYTEDIKNGQDSSGTLDDLRTGIAGNLKEAEEYSSEAAGVASRRHAEEWKEYAEEKARKRKKQQNINMTI